MACGSKYRYERIQRLCAATRLHNIRQSTGTQERLEALVCQWDVCPFYVTARPAATLQERDTASKIKISAQPIARGVARQESRIVGGVRAVQNSRESAHGRRSALVPHLSPLTRPARKIIHAIANRAGVAQFKVPTHRPTHGAHGGQPSGCHRFHPVE